MVIFWFTYRDMISQVKVLFVWYSEINVQCHHSRQKKKRIAPLMGEKIPQREKDYPQRQMTSVLKMASKDLSETFCLQVTFGLNVTLLIIPNF